MTFSFDWMSYNWQASLTTLVLTVALVALGRFLLFKVPAFARTRDHNRQANRLKIKTPKYPGRLSSSHKVAFFTYLVFVIAILPFIATFASQPLWKIIGNVVVILMVYDFFYYLMHRFLFHGQGYFRQVHAVHHQARKTNLTSIDALLLHPWEAFLGNALYIVVTAVFCLVTGQALHVASLVISILIYTQLNQINHVHFEQKAFPQKLLHWIGDKHSLHHIDMHHGNFSTITLLFDKMFGTYE
jgi:sterol desaturase/sphingolipid hydroxylase (fatty acid hydroxylase superfamily)